MSCLGFVLSRLCPAKVLSVQDLSVHGTFLIPCREGGGKKPPPPILIKICMYNTLYAHMLPLNIVENILRMLGLKKTPKTFTYRLDESF